MDQGARRSHDSGRGSASHAGSLMATFQYKAVNAHGTFSEGRLDAADTRAGIYRLQTMGLMVVSIEEPAGKRSSRSWKIYRQRVRRRELLFFTEELSTLTHAG